MENENKSFKEQWNEELDKKDLKKVCIKGLIICLIAVIVAAFIDYFLFRINGQFYVGILVIGPITAITISNSYEKYHIKYTFIALCYTLIGMILLNFFRLVLTLNFSFKTIFTSGSNWFDIFLHPIYLLVFCIKNGGNIGNFVFAVIELLFYVGTFFLAYKLSKKKQQNISE